jgi:hypothetical protein
MAKKQFYLEVKGLLDRSDFRDAAEELQELLNDTKLDLNSKEFEDKVLSIVEKTNKNMVQMLIDGFNTGIEALGKKIHIENMIDMSNTAIWHEFGLQAGKLFADGLSSEIHKALQTIDLSKLFDVKSFSKDRNLIKEATDRYIKRDGTVNKGKLKAIQSDYEYKVGKNVDLKSEMETVRVQYVDSTNWEEQYRAMLRYKKLGDQMVKNGVKLSDIPNIGQYTYEQIKEATPRIQESLQNIFNNLAQKPLAGLTDGGAVDLTVVPKVDQPLEVYDLIAVGKGKKVVEVEVKAKPVAVDDELSKVYEDIEALQRAYDNQDDKQIKKLTSKLRRLIPEDYEQDLEDILTGLELNEKNALKSA